LQYAYRDRKRRKRDFRVSGSSGSTRSVAPPGYLFAVHRGIGNSRALHEPQGAFQPGIEDMPAFQAILEKVKEALAAAKK